MTPEQIAFMSELTGFSEKEIQMIEILMEAAIDLEREACAQICDDLRDYPGGATPEDCAIAIRSRNDPEEMQVVQ